LAERDASTLPEPAELLRAALEKVVFFEWRVSELSAEIAAAHTRCANAEAARTEAEEEARAAGALAKKARAQSAELESERARLSSLLAHPAHAAPEPEPGALQAERRRSASLAAELEGIRGELNRSRAERERWLSEMVAQARSGDEAPAALAAFISELRGEVIALRDHQEKCEELLVQAGIAPPAIESPSASAAERRQPAPVRDARRMWEEGRLSPAPVATTHFAFPPEPRAGAAAHALADQCLRSLLSSDPARREQAARHLSAAPLPSAAPAIASALSQESDPKARAQLARALASCGGDGAAEIVAQLQSATEAPLVRMAALEALCAIPARSRAALEIAAGDEAPAVRRRAAAISASEGFDDLVSRFAADADKSVRAAVTAAKTEAPPERQAVAPAAEPAAAPATTTAAPAAPRDPVRAALRRLVLEGGSR
jgi:hypothetical protein